MDSLSNLTTLATHGLAGTSSFTIDFLIVIILFALFFLFAWYMGRGPFIALIISLYAGYALYSVFPYGSYLPHTPPLTALLASIAVFVALSAVGFLILRRAVVSDFVYIGIFGLIIVSFLGAGFLMALAYHVFPVGNVYTFTPMIDQLFAPKQYFFLWFAAPLLGLFFLAR